MKPRVVVLYEHGLDNQPFSSAYIRLINPLTYPKIINNYNIEFDTEYYGNSCDAVIIDRLWRPDISLNYAKSLLNDIHKTGVKLIYSCDDNFLEMPVKDDGWFNSEKVEIVKYFLNNADQVWATTDLLGQSFKNYSDNVFVIPNHFDDRLIFPNNYIDKKDNSVINIGYMGTYTHFQDLKLISNVLNEIGEKYHNQVHLQIIGISNSEEINHLLKNINFENINSCFYGRDYPSFIKWYGETINWDIAIAPLSPLPMNKYKSDLKFLDYSLIHAAGIYSDLEPYNSSKFIADCFSGIVTSNDEESWFNAIDTMIWNTSFRKKIAENAYNKFINFCTLKTGINYWIQALNDILK